jgi:hypothetical protein
MGTLAPRLQPRYRPNMCYRLLILAAATLLTACASAGSGAPMAPITGYRLPPAPSCGGMRYLEAKNPSNYDVTLTLIGADGLMRQLAPAMLGYETRRYGINPRDSVVTIRAAAVSVTGHQFDVNVSPHWGCDTSAVRRGREKAVEEGR